MPLASQQRLNLIIRELERRHKNSEGRVGSGKREKNATPSDFQNLESGIGKAFDIGVDILGVTPAGALAKGARVGIKGANASLLDDELVSMGFEEGLSLGQEIAAAFGLNDFGMGGPKSRRAGRKAAAEDALSGGQGFTSRSRGPRARGGLGRQKRGRAERGGRSAAERDPQGHGGGGRLGSDRNERAGGPR